MRGFTPQECSRREPLRQQALRKLHRFALEKGFHKVSRVLMLVGDVDAMAALDQADHGSRELNLLLGIHGVTLEDHGERKYTVKDQSGSFTFVDDHYGSGIEFLFGDIIATGKVDRPRELPLDLVPNSLSREITSVGEEVTPVGARRYLVGLHQSGQYPADLKHRLLGGSFEQLRALTLKQRTQDEVKHVKLAILKPKAHILGLLKSIDESADLETFVGFAKIGLATIRQTDEYQTVCNLSTKTMAKTLYDLTAADPVADAYLMGKVKKRGNLEIFSALCRRASQLK